ncbi:MAG: hypothetical protein ABFD77_09540 [Thermotogota bacterium]
MFKWGKSTREGSIKQPETGPAQVLCYQTFGLEEHLGKCPVCAAVDKALGSGDKGIQQAARRLRPTTYEVYQIIDLNEKTGGAPFTPQILYASPTLFNQIRAIINKQAAHGLVWDPDEGSALEIEFEQGDRPTDNRYTARCETNLLLPDGDYRGAIPDVDGEKVINLETGLYRTVLSEEAMAELLKTGDVLKAKKAGGVVNLETGEVEAVRFGDTGDAVDAGGNRVQFFNLKPGVNRIRILPPVEDDGVISIEVKRHFEVNLLPTITGAAGAAPSKVPPERFKNRAEMAETESTRAMMRGKAQAAEETQAAREEPEKAAEPEPEKATPPARKSFFTKKAPAQEPAAKAAPPEQAKPAAKPAPEKAETKPAPAAKPAAEGSSKQRAMDLIARVRDAGKK